MGNARHTAGIFADMTLDGPEIGTLVAVIDRAKNLPNRKTMGKQDPYCALRLGKEAKKTGTDKRGGQTPKWDQELRFTVHDSPDYCKLKCSVFNDDKKTDLIGEAWIDLTGVVVPGGGQNDLWHQLQFKGKYAGDVRMELTYYDTRPREGLVLEKRREKEKAEHGRAISSSNDGVGPRKLGPRKVKRRPLPAQPPELVATERPPQPEQVHSVPQPQLHQNESTFDLKQKYDNKWDPEYHYQLSNDTSLYRHQSSNERVSNDRPTGTDEHQQPQEAMYSTFPRQAPSSHDNLDHPGEHPDPDDFSVYSAQSSFLPTSTQPLTHTPATAERRHTLQTPVTQANRSSPNPLSAPYGSSPPSFSHERSTPGSVDHHNHPSFRRYSTSPIKNDVFRDSPLRQSVSRHDVEPPLQVQDDVSEDEGPPPPPPAHRSALPATASPPEVRQVMQLVQVPPPAHRSALPATASPPDVRQVMQLVQVPPPLNLGSNNRRMPPFDRSPLQSIERNYDPGYQSSVQGLPHSIEKEHSLTPYVKPNYLLEAQPAKSISYERPINVIENTPPSLRAGYNPLKEGTEESWTQAERHSHAQSPGHTTSQCRQDMSVLNAGGARYQMPWVEDEWQVSGSERPFAEPQVASPAAGIVPARKAVSPQPVSVPGEQRLDPVPFGPDSYDIFNPSSPLSSLVAGPDNRYETPEQAMEAARQHEVQKLRDQGPIIGNDGRIIDPSDHLPTDTWAPEPERKPRKPEMVIRYKTKENNPRTPHRYGSSPGSARPHSVAGSVYGSSPLATESPTSLVQQNNGRNRLQKQISGRPLPVQPYPQTQSSPAVPTANYDTPSPRSTYRPRPDLAEYPTHGQQQNHNNYRRGSLGGQYGEAPPIPAKVPIPPVSPSDSHGGYGGMDALSAELSTIDIGPGTGDRGERVRRGFDS